MTLNVSRYNYPEQFGPSFDRLMENIGTQILEGRYILTDEVKQFESAFASYLDTGHTIGLNSGTDALIIAMKALGIGPGDEVITQANTFYATVAAICFVGATPVIVDANPRTFLMDVTQVEHAITPNTRAILPAHMYGACTPMDALLRLSQLQSVYLLEDAAQCHGASFEGKRAGTFGEIGCFSFHPSKNFAAAGDAGACVTDSAVLADKIRVIRGLGQRRQNEHVALGLNSKLDSIQATILTWKLALLDAWNESRQQIAANYREQLAGLPLVFQETPAGSTHVYHLFQIKTDARDDLLDHLIQARIDAVVRYPQPIHLQPAFKAQEWNRGRFPVAEDLAATTLCLPIRPDMSETEINTVCGAVRSFYGARR
ncbi:UDP-4-amino-4-deoxy-L-arabinose--oxoglutarate aminotransferase [Candidatus Burkholderia pumila]|uniref:UDP-4-amino-4-deoxy-L-arabinose--oxoglutarate aminotransferase n=1 Tax=Candidatus Burkholderia pumila TaxID=1090375 RepID=A0ABR5HKS4_9BURK|nr:UDP-4-amino-4-deoxy-L-arabinose--oxoglutarate aminotransferase [Candidatus Burkholderia pumila]